MLKCNNLSVKIRTHVYSPVSVYLSKLNFSPVLTVKLNGHIQTITEHTQKLK